jgi:hypothetical protein
MHTLHRIITGTGTCSYFFFKFKEHKLRRSTPDPCTVSSAMRVRVHACTAAHGLWLARESRTDRQFASLDAWYKYITQVPVFVNIMGPGCCASAPQRDACIMHAIYRPLVQENLCILRNYQYPIASFTSTCITAWADIWCTGTSACTCTCACTCTACRQPAMTANEPS